MTGHRQAFVDISLAVLSSKSRRAVACVATYTVHTLSSIQTARFPGARLWGTVVLIHFTLKSYQMKTEIKLSIKYFTRQNIPPSFV